MKVIVTIFTIVTIEKNSNYSDKIVTIEIKENDENQLAADSLHLRCPVAHGGWLHGLEYRGGALLALYVGRERLVDVAAGDSHHCSGRFCHMVR